MLVTLKRWLKHAYYHLSLKNLIWISFSITTAVATVIMGISFYSRFSDQLKDELQKNNQALIHQVNHAVTTYMRDMMKLSDTLYFSIIKDRPLDELNSQWMIQLFYEANKDRIKNIGIFDEEGKPLLWAPAATLKENVEVKQQQWFTTALNESENLHFSPLHVQNLVDENKGEYEWVISLSRAVQLMDRGEVKKGVLLIDLSYGGFKQLFNNVLLGPKGYIYVLDKTGGLLYHPKQQLIASGRYEEPIDVLMTYRDGVYSEKFRGNTMEIGIKTVGYTGWRIISNTFPEAIGLNRQKSQLFFVFLFIFFLTGLLWIHSLVSDKVSLPIRRLEEAVSKVEKGNLDTPIAIEGFYEVRHLGQSVQSMSIKIKELMEDVVREHENKRKSELDVLQSQINPHFLYNTLDIIVWMIENEEKEDAAKVVTALARFFRISLSKGKTMITLEEELEHVYHYLTIQQLRYRHKFAYDIKISDGVKSLYTLKLIVQPLVENAIYHGMIYADGEGRISIEAYEEEEKVCISINDNGLGMTEEKVDQLLKGTLPSSKKGSGIGVKNVNQRLKLYFGEAYGIAIDSELDRGTKVIVTLPRITSLG